MFPPEGGIGIQNNTEGISLSTLYSSLRMFKQYMNYTHQLKSQRLPGWHLLTVYVKEVVAV